MNNPKYRIVEVQPAFVAHCSDVNNRKLYYIHVFEGPPSSQSFKVFDENDREVKTIGVLNLGFSDVSETYRALVNTPDGPLQLNIVGIQPWLNPNILNGESSQSSTTDTSAS
jgi:hypothetical protein